MRRISVPIIAAVLLMSGCAAKQIKTYEGPEKPLQEIALVKCDPWVWVHGVDGNKAHRVYAGDSLLGRGCAISVLPGQHTFDVCFETDYWHCEKDISVPLDARAGRIYRIKLELDWKKWKPWIEDVTEGERAK